MPDIIQVKSKFTKDKLISRIKDSFLGPPEFKQIMEWTLTPKKYYVLFIEDKFSLVSSYKGWLFSHKIFTGSVVDDNNGSMIDGKFRRDWMAVFIMFSIIIAGFAMATASTDFSGLKKQSMISFGLISAGIIIILYLLILTFNSIFNMNRQKNEITDIFKKCADED